MRCLVRLEAAESGQKSPKTVISRQAAQSAVNRIGGAGEGGRESCSAHLGAAIGHPRPQDAAARSVSGNPRAGSAPRRGPEAGRAGRAFRRRALGAAPRFADSEPPAPLRRVCAALSGSDRRRGCDRSQSAPSGCAGGVRGGDRRRLTDSRRGGAGKGGDPQPPGAGRGFGWVGVFSPVAAEVPIPQFKRRHRVILGCSADGLMNCSHRAMGG